MTTWNVLHRVHAVNWKETPIRAFPVEQVRIDEITSRVARWLEGEDSIVGLEEVSGDQLASLRRAFGADATIVEHTFPRVPSIRGGEPLELTDPTEHLVVIVKKGVQANRLVAKTFDTDPGKGFLAVDLGGITFVVTHVSARERGPQQLRELSTAASSVHPRAIVVGDFNAPHEDVAAAFAPDATISALHGQRPTRIASADRAGRKIDHVVVIGGAIVTAAVQDGDLLSDHNPVTATLRFDG